MTALARRYAQAAVDAASDEGGSGAIEDLATGLGTFADAYKESEELRELVRNPALKGQRADVLGSISQRLGLSQVARSLVLLLCENDRIDALVDVALEVERLADEQLGRHRARVVSAIELSDAERGRLSAALEKRLRQRLILDIEIDPTILGGLIIEVGNFTIDSSVRRQLELLAERLHGGI